MLKIIPGGVSPPEQKRAFHQLQLEGPSELNLHLAKKIRNQVIVLQFVIKLELDHLVNLPARDLVDHYPHHLNHIHGQQPSFLFAIYQLLQCYLSPVHLYVQQRHFCCQC